MAIRNAGTTTMKFNEGVVITGENPHNGENQLVVDGNVSIKGIPGGGSSQYTVWSNSTPTVTETMDRVNWFYTTENISSNDTTYQPKLPQSQGAVTANGIPILNDSGGYWNQEIYTFWGAGTRMISLKNPVEGTVTVKFKLISGGGGSYPANVPYSIPLADYNGGYYFNLGGQAGNFDWNGGSSDGFYPIRLMTSKEGYATAANWTAVDGASYHAHHTNHPQAASKNITQSGFTHFSVTISNVSGPFYIALVQDEQTPDNFNAWGLADFQISTSQTAQYTTNVDGGYINFEGQVWNNGEPGMGFRNNAGTMEYKNDSGYWRSFDDLYNDLTIGGIDQQVQYNDNGSLGGANTWYNKTTSKTTFDGNIEGKSGIVSTNLTYDPNEDGGEFQFSAKGSDSLSAGISFGNETTIGAGIVGEASGGSLGTATLKFQTRPALGSGLQTRMEIDAVSGNLGVGVSPPSSQYKIHANGTIAGSKLKAMYSTPEVELTTVNVPTVGSNIGKLNSNDQADISVIAAEDWDSVSKGCGLQINATHVGETVKEAVAYLSPMNSFVYSRFTSSGGLWTSTLEASGLGTFNGGIVENSVDGITITDGTAALTTQNINCNRYFTNARAKDYSTEFLSTNYMEQPSGYPDGYSDVTFKSIDDFTVMNRDNSRYLVRVKNQTSTGNYNKRGKLVLTSNTLFGTTAYKIAEKSSPHGMWIEGSSTGTTNQTLTSAVTICNMTSTEYSDGTFIGQTNGDGGQRSDLQAGLDIIAGKGAISVDSTGWPTTSTKYIRFITPVYNVADGSDPLEINGNEYGLNNLNPKGNELNTPIIIGKITGDGSGGVTYHQSFTGQHASVIDFDDYLQPGMIVSSTGNIWHGKTLTTALPKVELSVNEKDKAVYGVISTLEGEFEGYTTRSPLKEGERHIEINSLGEGRVWVTNYNGNITNGDYITTSIIPGYGVKQDDDILHSYTVAKCTESINWEKAEDISHNGQTYKKYLAACTYHCG